MNKNIITAVARHLLTAIGGSLVALGVLDESSAAEAAGAVAALIGVGWSIWEKRRLAAEAAAGVKTIPLALIGLLVGALALGAGSGCQTTNKAGRTLASITVTVDHAMQGWMHWVAAGKATAQDERMVKFAYETYQDIEAVAESAYESAYKAKDETAMTAELRTLTESRDNLLGLIAKLQGKAIESR
jgi:hypothetical protein